MATTTERGPFDPAGDKGGAQAAANRRPGAVWAGRTFDSLGNRNFRYMWIGMLIAMGAIQMQMLANSILVYEIQDSQFIASVVSMGFAPSMLIVSLFGGVIGEKFERRTIIQISQVVNALLGLVIGVLVLTDLIHWTHLLCVAIAQGAMFAIQMPARQAAIPTLVGRERMSNAIALNAMAMGLMNLAGPSLGGFIYGFASPEAVYFTVMGMGLVAVGFTSRLPRMYPAAGAVKKRVWQDIKDGFSYIGQSSILKMLLLQTVIVALLSMPARMMIAVFAKDVYSASPPEVSMLTAAGGLGGLIGALGIAGLRSGQRRGLVTMVAAVLSGVSILLMGSVPFYLVGIFAMVGIGLGESGRWALGQALVMEQTGDQYRARVMSVMMMTFGLMPIGLLPLGAAMEAYGAQPSVLVMGMILLVVSVLFIVFSKSVRRLS